MTTEVCRVCSAPAQKRYLTGWCCPDHTPAAFAGRAELVPDPRYTLDGLRKAAGIDPNVPMTPAGPTLVDQRAISSGKRRSSHNDFRAAQAATQEKR